MKISVNNVGCIKEANVNIDGLTVIAGENGSGKSTLSKIIFSTIKAMVNISQDGDSARRMKLNKYTKNLYNRLGGNILHGLDGTSPLPRFSRQLEIDLWAMRDDESVGAYIVELKNYIFGIEDIAPRTKSLAIKDLDGICALLMPQESIALQLGSEIRYFVESEFMNQITTKGTSVSKVTFVWGPTREERVEYDVRNEEMYMVGCNNHYDVEDATYVETPLYLPLLDALNHSSTYVENTKSRNFQPMVPLHVKDIANKYNMLSACNMGQKTSLMKQIEEIIGGQFEYDAENRNIQYRNEHGEIFSPMNVASGVKTLGLLQILLQTKALGPNKPLLWDEPENHMHPAWQVKFAEMLVVLAKAGIPIVVSTHSPYFVQAIRFYTVQYSLESFVNYYLSEKDKEGLSVVSDVTTDLNRLFSKLAEPLQQIMNISVAANNKKK